jgi:Protein of unknown function (DUF4232)
MGSFWRRPVRLAPFMAGAALVMMTGCSSGGSPSAAVTKTVTATAPASPSAATPATVPSTTSPAGPGPCQSGALKVSLGSGDAGAGTQELPIEFTNVSSTSCTLYGYPGISFSGETYAVQVGPAAVRNPHSPETVVTLAPGGVASAQVSIVDAQNYPAGACGLTTASGIVVYPPNLTTPVGLPFNGYTCVHTYNVLTVDPVVAGPGT